MSDRLTYVRRPFRPIACKADREIDAVVAQSREEKKLEKGSGFRGVIYL